MESVVIHPSVRVHPTARIDCANLTIGAGGVVGENCVIEGTRVEIGRELWMDAGARIGGGSCRDSQAFLRAGDWLHLGKGSELNIARGITLGDEVGIGIGSGLFTHGAYLDELAGFPCAFAPIVVGSRVWLPNAWVNPGVTIGDDVVVGARSLVNRDLPSGCLAGGVPARVLRDGVFPRRLDTVERHRVIDRIAQECRALGAPVVVDTETPALFLVHSARFDLHCHRIEGRVSPDTEIVRNQLRRHGIRFRCSPVGDHYEAWS